MRSKASFQPSAFPCSHLPRSYSRSIFNFAPVPIALAFGSPGATVSLETASLVGSSPSARPLLYWGIFFSARPKMLGTSAPLYSRTSSPPCGVTACRIDRMGLSTVLPAHHTAGGKPRRSSAQLAGCGFRRPSSWRTRRRYRSQESCARLLAERR